MDKTDNVLNLLSLSPFFREISLSSKQKIATIAVAYNAKKGATLFMEGDGGSDIYLVATGAVQLSKFSADGKETVIKIIGKGELFAEVILFETDKYPVNAVVIKNSELFKINKVKFLMLLGEESFRNDFIRIIMKKQRYLTEQIHNLTSFDVEERFFKFLEDQYGNKKEYNIDLSKKDIAGTIKTNPETLSRLIAKLKDEGRIVSWIKGKLVLA